ncbi:MAG: PD-(D/E)XK nuclease family protein, partial [Bacteroidota bacterium]|nr:PD-(D/E)XK nuclease family protein [Bacteroidota bacterium]
DVDHTVSFHEWANWFQSFLLNHFPYIAPKSPTQEALYALWIKTVYEARPLEFIAEPLFDYHSWLDCVFVHLDNTYYNDTSISNIVVMSWSHALEMPFDSLIFLSCHSGNWPPSINDDAIDSTQQSCYASIHTTLTHSAKKIRFLSPLFDDQAQPLLPSFFLVDLINDTVADFNKHLPYYTCPNQAILKKDQNFGPEISESERSISTSVLQSYSRCHAQGFLQHRLNIQTQKPDSYGIGPADVGTLIHELLASFDDIKTDHFPTETQVDNKINLLLSSQSKYRYLSSQQKNTLSIHLHNLLRDWLIYRMDAHKNDTIIESQHELALEKTLFGLTF